MCVIIHKIHSHIPGHFSNLWCIPFSIGPDQTLLYVTHLFRFEPYSYQHSPRMVEIPMYIYILSLSLFLSLSLSRADGNTAKFLGG